MPLASWTRPDRKAPHRRWWLLVLLLPLALLAWEFWPGEPPLSEAERMLVGEWGYPQVESPLDYGIAAKPLTKPWQVWEFAPDRAYRHWYVSADDPGQRHKMIEGRWRIVEGMLHFEDMPGGTRRFVRDARIWIVDRTSLPRTELSPSGLRYDVPYRLEGDELVIAVPIEELPIARRLPGGFRHAADPAVWKVRRDDAFPDWARLPGGRWVRTGQRP
jgi:hypothetical protein